MNTSEQSDGVQSSPPVAADLLDTHEPDKTVWDLMLRSPLTWFILVAAALMLVMDIPEGLDLSAGLMVAGLTLLGLALTAGACWLQKKFDQTPRDVTRSYTPREAKSRTAGAVGLSLLLCGLGQCFNGQFIRGLQFLLACFLAWFLFLGWVFYLWSIIDAGVVAWKRTRYLKGAVEK